MMIDLEAMKRGDPVRVVLKSIERLENGSARICFIIPEHDNDFTFVIPRVNAPRVCKNIIDFAFVFGCGKLFIKIVTWERTGEDSILLISEDDIGDTKTRLQITRYEMEQNIMEKQCKKCTECGKPAIYERCGFYYCEKCAISIPFYHKCAGCGLDINLGVSVASDVEYNKEYDLYCSKECYLKSFGYGPIWYECDETEETEETEESLEVRQL